jgi:histidinol-phosphate aminotransferase
MLSRILLQEGANIITELPSFSSYFSEANIQDANIKTIAFNDNYSFDLKEMLKLIDENTKMIYITNPNNPLGSIVKKDEIISFVKNVPENILIVFDEAYGEFVRDEDYISAVSLVKEYKNVCVLKTFSKAYGLAALRIGYILADEEVINELEKVRVPFNVSTISQMCASIALDDESHIKYVTDSVHSTIDYMYKELNNMKLQFIKTEANFIMLNVGKNSKEVVYELLKKGYIVRDGFPLMDTWIRVSIGKREDMENFCKILKEVI